MKWIGISFLLTALVFSLGLGACNSTRPTNPARVVSMNVAIPATSELHSSLLTASSNELLYRVDGPGMTTIKGTLGPFASPAASGSIDFTLAIPSGPNRVLSLQLNDASTHQPLALGAADIDFTSTVPVSELVVDMGSVTRTCYYTYNTSFSGNYGFAGDAIGSTTSAVMDISYNTPAGISVPASIFSANPTPIPNIAYMGNGNFVDYDYVPPDANFTTTSAVAKLSGPISIGDIFCIKLQSIPNGHAWVQITNPGNGSFYIGPFFRYRVNSSSPYYAYERTQADINGTCSTTW